jgi:hypothetical protein
MYTGLPNMYIYIVLICF